MSGPSFKNIDLWLFELAEGNLSPAQTQQLELFLLQYPEIDIERDMWNAAKVQPQTTVYPDQQQLIKKRPIGWFYLASAASIGILFTIAVSDYSISNNSVKSQILVANVENESKISQLEGEVVRLKAQLKTSSKKRLNVLEQYRTDDTYTISSSSDVSSKVISTDKTLNNEYFSATNNEIDLLTNTSPVGLLNENNEIENALTSSFVNDYSSEEREVVELEKFRGIQATQNIEDVIAKNYERKNKFPTFSSSDYSVSLKNKMKKATRTLQRMMNNPIALTNYRDPSFHLPGKLNNDINFSSTGTMLATKVQAMSRLQWYGEDNEQLINQLAVDGYVYGMRGGLGLQLNHSTYRNGAINISSAALTYSPKISVNRSISVEPSVRFKMGAKTLASSKMEGVDKVEIDRQNVYDYYSEGTSPIGNELWYKDLGLGLMVNTKWFYVGAQVDNLFEHYDNMYSSDFSNQHKASNNFIAVAGTDWVSKDKSMGISPYLLYQENEHLSELWVGVNFRYNWFVIGGGVSSLLDPGASLELKFDHFSVKYNADYTMSSMTEQRSLSHQLTLKFIGETKKFGRRTLKR